MQKGFLAGATALVVLAASAVQAQDSADVGRFPVGSYISITPAMVIVGGYDSNFIRANDGEGASEFYASPQIEAWLGRGRTKLNVVAAVEAQGSVTAAFNQFYRLRGEAGSALMKVTGTVSHRDHAAPPTDFVGFEVGLRSRRIEREFIGGVAVTPGRVRLGVDANHLQLRYDAVAIYQGSSLRDNLNRDTTWLNAGADFALTPFAALSATVGHVDDTFLFAPHRDGSGWRALAGISLATRAPITGYARFGVLQYKTKLSGISYSGPAHMVGLQAFRRSFFVDVQANREIRFSFDPSRGFYLSNGFDGYSSLKIGGRVETFLRGSLRTVAPQGPAAAFEPTRRVWLAKTGLVLRITQFTRIGTEVERYVYGGAGGFSGTRTIAFMIWGPETMQRLDRPLPGQF
jgi:hypothetical protein